MVLMSEDARAFKVRRVLYVANPGSDSDEASEEDRRKPPPRAPYVPPAKNRYPASSPALNIQKASMQHTHPNPPPIDTSSSHPSFAQPNFHLAHPSLSSPSSTSSPAAEESTPPPSTPGLPAPPVDLVDTPSAPDPAVSFNDRGGVSVSDNHNPTSRTGKLLQTLKAPFGGRSPRPVTESSPKPSRTSPTVATPDSYTSISSHDSTPTASGRVLIVVTADSERYFTVDVSDAKNVAFIRECIFTKLNIYNEDEQKAYSIYQTEIGAYAIGEALTDEKLFNLCTEHGDARGSLKFFVSHSSADVHEQPAPIAYEPTIPPPPILPNIGGQFTPLRPRRRSRSRHGSISSTSEQLPQEVLPGSGYEADLDNPDRDGHRSTLRPAQQPLPIVPTTIGPLSPHRKPSGPAIRSSSPHPPRTNSPPLINQEWHRPQGEGTLTDKYGQVLSTPQSLPLSPNRPIFPIHDDKGLAPPLRPLHVRSGSDAGAEREIALRASEQQLEGAGRQQRRSREPIERLRAEASKDTSSQGKDQRQRKRYQNESEDNLGRSDSWVFVPQRSESEVTQIAQEAPRPPPVSRNARQATNRYQPPSPFAHRGVTIPDTPRQRPTMPSTSTGGETARTQPTPRPAGVPLPPSFVVTWKGEEGGHRKPINKGFTKSMDNLKSAASHPDILQPGQPGRRDRPQLPMNRTPRNPMLFTPNTLGMPKSYDPPRSNLNRPLPVSGSLHGSTTEYNPSMSSYNSRLPSSLTTSSHDPYARPQSAAGDAAPSPSQRQPRPLQSPTYFDPLDSSRSPRTMSPSRSYHLAGIPGPRPKPTLSERSERSSDIQSGPETSNTTPPRTPISPQSPRNLSGDKNGFLHEPSSPLDSFFKSEMSHNSDATLKPDEQTLLGKLVAGLGTEGTLMSSHLNEIHFSAYSGSSSQSHSQDDTDSDTGGGTWIVPFPPSRPPLKVQIETSTNSSLTSSRASQPSLPPLPPGSSSNYRAPTVSRSVAKNSRDKRATFMDTRNDSWAPRPPAEDVYERLEEFFPEHDLDKPVIEANSGGTSPTATEPVLAPPVPAEKSRVRAKKSIRIVAQEHKSRIDRTSRSDASAFTTNMLRKRNTKLWGSKLEEVTTIPPRSTASAAAPESPSGGPTTFKWVRGELIGKGTYGRVYLALNATTGEMIAVKQVELPQTASDKNDSRQVTVVQALKMESETLKDLDHPNIVQYLGFEETPSNLSIFLEYVPGGSVGSCLHRHGKFDDNVTRSFTAQILSGLEYLHSKGILHRDLKADNILVEMEGNCKISDFGISKRTEDLHGGAYTALQGTVFWMAPEVINTQKKGYNNKVDIWSVGCVVLEMWAGMRPWMGEETVAVMFKLYQAKLPPPVPEDVVLSEIADDFRRICFAINPEERPSAAELRKHPYLELPSDWTFTGFTSESSTNSYE